MISKPLKPRCDDGPIYSTADGMLGSKKPQEPRSGEVQQRCLGTVFVQGDFANKATRDLFSMYGYQPVESIEEADIVCWTGGEDINPALYGENPCGAHYWNDIRDKKDLKALDKAEGKFLVGICRGAQLLNCVPNGGKLWQDVDNHGSCSHEVTDKITGERLVLNSIHHQALKLTDKAELVAFTNISTRKESEPETWHRNQGQDDPDVEVAFYPETRSLLMQSHPEFAPTGSTGRYFNNLMKRYYLAA